MNAKLENWLNEQKQKDQQKKINHLIELGLCEETDEQIKKIVPSSTPNCFYDKEMDRYCIYEKKKEAIEVSDEEYELICRHAHFTENKKDYGKEQMMNDLHNTRNWIKFFGILTIIGLIISAIIGLALAFN